MAGYLVRNAYMEGQDLHLTADFNKTTPIEVIGAPTQAKNLYINGQKAPVKVDKNGIWSSSVTYNPPNINLPALSGLSWKYIDSLPEIQNSYDDSAWPAANHHYTNNSVNPLKTPTSLYGSDYGFNTGTLLYRGHFVATGNEKNFFVHTQGGSAFGSSVWLNSTYVGSWPGIDKDMDYNATYTLPKLQPGKTYVITVVVDTMGLDENWVVGSETMKNPRGILNYTLSSRPATAISWKLTGNLGGENYRDLVRGPLNEGGLYAERQGYHQPNPPTQNWQSGSPLTGLSRAGIRFYSASFNLNLPHGWDIPLYFNFGNTTTPPADYRAQLFINGYQFGKYVNNIGPQGSYPVPEGILNYRGTNWIGLSLWAQEANGAHLDSLELVHTTPVLSGMSAVSSVEQPKYTRRPGAY